MKHAILSLCVAAALAGCAGDKFHVSGTVTSAADSVLYFENMSLDGPVVVDSTVLDKDGTFSFSGDRVEAPEFYRLRIAGQIVNVSIDSTETVTVVADYRTMSSQYKVSGSRNCEKIRELSLLQQQLLARCTAVADAPGLGVAQSQDSIEALVAAYKRQVLRQYIYREPQQAYAYFALFQALGPRLIFNPRTSTADVKAFAAVATSWDTFHPGALRGQNLHNIAMEGIKAERIIASDEARVAQVLDPKKVKQVSVIDVSLPDAHGRQRKLTDLAGQVVLLDFHVFASKGSTARIMQLRELYNKYHSRGLEIYQVSLDGDEHFWKTQTAALPWVSVRDEQGAQSTYLTLYNVQTVPTFFLIDRTPALHARDAQIKDLAAEIEKLL